MNYDLSGVDVFFLSKELKRLENAKVDKIVQIDRHLFLLRFFSGKEKINVRILVPELLNISDQKYESPLLPLGFCTFLRKYLQNTKIKKIYQKGFERIIVFEFETLKYGDLILILEFFKPGNIILCKKEDDKLLILNSLERQEFKSRKICAGEEYLFPPLQKNPFSLNIEALKEILESSDKILGKTFAIDLSLGGTYAEEIIVRGGLDKNKESKELSSHEIKIIYNALQEFFNEEIYCSKLKEKIYPVRMKSIKTEEVFESFNKGLDSIHLEMSEERKKISSRNIKSAKSKNESLLDIQVKRLSSLEKEIDENQKAGEFIYEHYQEFSRLIDAVRKMRKDGKTYDEIEEELKKNKHFKNIDKAKKSVLLEF